MHSTATFIKELSSQYLPFKMFNPKTKKLEDRYIRVGVEKLELYVCNFPEEHKDLILNTIYDGSEKGQHGWYKWLILPLRKLMHLKPIPKYDRSKKLALERKDLEVIGIGMFDDYFINPDGSQTFDKKKRHKDAFEGI